LIFREVYLSIVLRAVWQVAPSCWITCLPDLYVQLRPQEFYYHIVMYTIHCHCIACCIFKEIQLNHSYAKIRTKVARDACNDFSRITRGFSAPQFWLLCLFTYSFSWKCACLKRIFFEKFSFTLLDFVTSNWQMGTMLQIVCWLQFLR